MIAEARGERRQIVNDLFCASRLTRADSLTTMIIAPYRNNVRQVVVLNPKGGCGKTTLATNLASYYALRGSRPMLIDNDPKGYTTRWLEKRPESSSRILGISSASADIRHESNFRPRIPREIDTVIIDTPAALHQQDISRLTKNVDCILIPVLPSAFDVHVSTSFIANLLVLTQFECPVAVVANRTRKNTKSLSMLMRILANLETPTIAVLRDSQNYVYAASLGLGIYELPESRVKKDVADMHGVVSWLDRSLARTWDSATVSPFVFQPRSVLQATTGFAQNR